MTMQGLQEDIAELQRLLDLADRPKVKDLFSLHIRKWQTELAKLEEAEKKQAAPDDIRAEKTEPAASAPVKTKEKTTVKELRQYAWDQTDKFMKLYVDVPEVHTMPESNITAEYKTRYVKVTATVKNITYVINVGPFHNEVVTEQCKYKVKSDKILIMLKKQKEKETWPYVIAKNDKKSKVSPPPLDENKDPSESLMTMLKQMYDDGDDEMKRTIAKSWHQSQQGKGASNMSGVDDQ